MQATNFRATKTCRRCNMPLVSARLKGPTTGWYCTPCYVGTFITPQVMHEESILKVAAIGADLDLVREYQSTHQDSPEDIYKRLCAGELQELLRG